MPKEKVFDDPKFGQVVSSPGPISSDGGGGGPGHMAQTMAGNLLSRSFPIPWEESG